MKKINLKNIAREIRTCKFAPKKWEFETIEQIENLYDEHYNNLSDYARDFLGNYADIDHNTQHICDAISDFADNNTSIYYSDIKNFIADHIEEVNEAIAEFGWDGCGSDLYKAGQMAEYLTIEREIYNNLDDIIICAACKYLIDNDISLRDEQLEQLQEDLNDIDNNNRLNDILDIINNITDSEDKAE